MQPVVYLLVRIALTWLQYLERETRAFVHDTQVVLVAGAAHCWAVVYALFVAVLARVSRENHVGYVAHEELLPWWVQGTERLAAFAMVVWWFAGCLRLLVHILEDDAKVLPMDRSDLGIPALLRAARSPLTRLGLAAAQAVSCAGLFVSVVLLCVALLVLAGPASAFEWGLVLVGTSFALPLTIVALQRAAGLHASVGRAAMAAAAETASLGPQFCVILALLDVLDASSFWSRLLCPAAAAMFTAAVCACAYVPPKLSGSAVSPDVSELALSALLDVVAVAALTLAFTMQSWWVLLLLGAMIIVLAITCAAMSIGIIRHEVTELLEPIMPLQSDHGKRRPGLYRDYLRTGSRALVLISSLSAFWDVTHHVSRLSARNPGYDDYHHDSGVSDSHGSDGSQWDGHYDHTSDDHHWDHHYDPSWDSQYDHAHDRGTLNFDSPPLVLRWLSSDPPDEHGLIEAAAEAFKIESWSLSVSTMITEQRLLVLSFTGPEDKRPLPKSQWQDLLLESSDAKMFTVGDTTFPTHLNKDLCDKAIIQDAPLLPDFVDADAQAAYAAGCSTWMTHDYQHHSSVPHRDLGEEPGEEDYPMHDEWNEYSDGMDMAEHSGYTGDDQEVYQDSIEPEAFDGNDAVGMDTAGESPNVDEAVDQSPEGEVQASGEETNLEDAAVPTNTDQESAPDEG